MKIISIANTTFHLKISEHVLDVLVLCACIILKMHKSMEFFLSIIELITKYWPEIFSTTTRYRPPTFYISNTLNIFDKPSVYKWENQISETKLWKI